MAELLCSATDPEWLELRRTGITASDLPVIMGLISWDSPWALYHRKRGTLPETEQTDRMRLGSWLESSIAREWVTGHSVYMASAPPALWQNDDRPWQMATPDKLVNGGVLECKTSATRDGWGEDRTGEVPASVRAQVLWQMDTLGVPAGHVAVVFLPSGEFRSYTIQHRHDPWLGGDDRGPACPFAQGSCAACNDIDAMRKAALEFYRRVTGELPAPPVDHLTVTTKALQEVYAGFDETAMMEIDRELYDAYMTGKAIAKSAAEDLDLYKNLLREAMGKAGVATVNGTPVIRRQVNKRGGYTVEPGVQDKLVSIKPKEDQ